MFRRLLFLLLSLFVCSILLLAAFSPKQAAGDKLPIINIDGSIGNFENDYTSEAYTALLSTNELAKYGLRDDEDDSNPLLLCVDFENYHIN